MNKGNITKLVGENISDIRKLLFGEESPEAPEVNELEAAQAKLVDGTILNIDPSLEVGAKVDVLDEAGDLTAAPDGEHELQDGTLITVEGGIIVELVPVEGEEVVEEEMSEEGAPVEEVQAPFDIEKLQKQLINKLNVAITEKIDKLRFAKVEELDALKAENATLKEATALLIDVVEKFNEEPKEAPKKTARNPFKKETSRVNVSNLLKK